METKELDIKKNTLEQQAAKLRKQRRLTSNKKTIWKQKNLI